MDKLTEMSVQAYKDLEVKMIDFYNNNKVEEIESIKVFFNDSTCKYWGYGYIKDKIVCDFSFNSCQDLQKAFKHLNIIWRYKKCIFYFLYHLI